jgi:hypothetical protein
MMSGYNYARSHEWDLWVWVFGKLLCCGPPGKGRVWMVCCWYWELEMMVGGGGELYIPNPAIPMSSPVEWLQT